MKILIVASLLILNVSSSCSGRPISKCLKDEHCQIVGTKCRTRPERCKEIDASNPKNCAGKKCYYDEEEKLCRSNEFSLSQRHRDLNNGQEVQLETSKSQDEDEIRIQSSTQKQDNSVNPNSVDSKVSSNYENLNSDDSQQNITNTKVDYSQQDTIIFEIADSDININELMGEDYENNLIQSASVCVLSTLIIFQLLI